MKRNNVTLISRGIEEIYYSGEKMRRTVWQDPTDKNYYIRLDGEFIRVYRKSYLFSDCPEGISFRQYCGRYGYSAKVYDRPSRSWVNLCEYNKEEERWQDCLFETIEEAVAAQERYEEAWRDHYTC